MSQIEIGVAVYVGIICAVFTLVGIDELVKAYQRKKRKARGW